MRGPAICRGINDVPALREFIARRNVERGRCTELVLRKIQTARCVITKSPRYEVVRWTAGQYSGAVRHFFIRLELAGGMFEFVWKSSLHFDGLIIHFCSEMFENYYILFRDRRMIKIHGFSRLLIWVFFIRVEGERRIVQFGIIITYLWWKRVDYYRARS